jgi:CubicO group peptidase (beta-lactamase class C family)
MKKRQIFGAIVGLLSICVLLLPFVTLAKDELTDESVSKFAKEFFPKAMEEKGIPGAVFVVVKDGKVIHQSSFGVADIASKNPIIPDKTLFRLASMSKLVTATAVMQLVERGKLGLDDEIEKYIGFKLRNPFETKVTARHLLTHTSGLDNRAIGTFTPEGCKMPSLYEHLKNFCPPVIVEPGTRFSYSNYGFGLLGLAVENLSGMSFESYIQKNILSPLGMNDTTFDQAHIDKSRLALGYFNFIGGQQPVDYRLLNIPPAGAMIGTTTDFAKFMIMHLQNGQFDGKEILNIKTAKLMQKRHFQSHKDLNGACIAFDEGTLNGMRVLSHNGNIPGYGSTMYLVPEKNIGFFAIFTNNLKQDVLAEIAYKFFDRFFPAPKKEFSYYRIKNFAKRAQHFTGTYFAYSFTRSSVEKAIQLTDYYTVKVADDGSLLLPNGTRWIETSPLYFQCLDKESEIAFAENENGEVTDLFMGWATFKKLGWFETAYFWRGVLIFCLVIFLSVLLWPLRSLLNLILKRKRFASLNEITFWLAGLSAVLNVFFCVFAVLLFFDSSLQFLEGVNIWFYVVFTLPIITTAILPFSAYFGFMTLKHGCHTGFIKFHTWLVILAQVVFVAFLLNFNLLGFNF